jgi:hypothetical protein
VSGLHPTFALNLPEKIATGVWKLTHDNVDQFKD